MCLWSSADNLRGESSPSALFEDLLFAVWWPSLIPLHRCAGFIFYIWTHILIHIWQVLYPRSHLPSPVLYAFKIKLHLCVLFYCVCIVCVCACRCVWVWVYPGASRGHRHWIWSCSYKRCELPNLGAVNLDSLEQLLPLRVLSPVSSHIFLDIESTM